MNRKVKELNKRNNELDQKIEEKNDEVLTNMICYLRGADISAYHQELVRNDLLEMVLSAQERGEDIQTVIGGDYKEFCDDIIANLPPKTMKQKVVDFFDTICLCLVILGIINIVLAKETSEIIKNFITGAAIELDISVSLGDIISVCFIIVVSVMIVSYVTKNSFKESENKKSAVLKMVLLGIGFMAVFLLVHWFGRNVLFSVNIFVTLAAIVGLFLVHKILEKC